MSALPAEFFDVLKANKVVETAQILWVSASEQRLRLFVHRLPTAEFSVSTANNGLGCRVNSYQTPTGLLRIARKIGDGEPVGTIFKERLPAGVFYPSSPILHPPSDLILTRILWLEGLELGINRGGDVDTFSRYIYIHGTNHEEKIGQPASHGCIRMRNDDVLNLFDAVEVGSLVWVR